MSRIHVLGGTGYAGAALVAEAAARGHEVTAFARSLPADPVEGVRYVQLDVFAEGALAKVVAEADAVIATLSPRGSLETALPQVHRDLARQSAAAGVRLGILGGAGSSLVTEGGPRVMDGDFPEAALGEAIAAATTLDDMRAWNDSLDWFVVSPAAMFGHFNPSATRGQYRTGGDVLVVDEAGVSDLSAGDLAIAIMDEVETPRHRRQRFTVGY